MRSIYIYNDEGVSQRSVLACQRAIKKWTAYPSCTIDASTLLQGAWTQDALALVMPGGADLFYGQKLNGLGNNIIRQYVCGGGNYLGICAGAYYASAYCDFHRGDEQEVLGERELAFYQGSAVGPTLAAYDERSEQGMRKARILWGDGVSYDTYFNGGCYFPGADVAHHTKVLGHYIKDSRRIPAYGRAPLPAVVQCSVEKGQAILCGIHPEYTLAGDENHLLFRQIMALLTAQPE